jgi:hypothetical protein
MTAVFYKPLPGIILFFTADWGKAKLKVFYNLLMSANGIFIA